MHNKKWVTLLEILITIFLLIILWTILVFSLNWYFTVVRDSNRIVELDNIERSIHSYMFRKWYYPYTTNWVDITYSWWLIWSQTDFSDNISSIILYSNGIVDPLTKTSYTYSVKNSKKEFSIAWVLEDWFKFLSFNLNTYAEWWSKNWRALVKWNYNWELISVNIDWINNILALPSIISSDLSSTDLLDIVNNNKLVYDNYINLPASYSWSIYNMNNDIDFSSNNLVVFTWSISDLKESTNQINLLKNIFNSYSWSILWNKISVNRIDSNDLFSETPSVKIKIFACDIINSKVKYPVDCNLFN